MKLPRFLTEKKVGDERQPPKVIMWIPPSGRVVECANLNEASLGASALAGEKPGTKVCVYELVGVAFVPITYPEVEPQDRESERLLAAPVDGGEA